MDIMLLFSPWVCCKSAEIDAEVMFPFPHRQTPIINGKCDAIRICVYGLLDIWLSTTTSPLILLAQIPQQPQQPLLIALVHWEYQCTSQAGLRKRKRKIVSSQAVLLCNCLQHPELRFVLLHHLIIQPSSPPRLENGFLPFFVLNRLYWKHHIMKKQMESDWALTPIRIKQQAIVLSLRHSQLKRLNIKGLCNLCTEDYVIILLC